MKFSRLSLTWFFLSILVFVYISRYDTIRAVSLVRRDTFTTLEVVPLHGRFLSDALRSWLKAAIFVIAAGGWGWVFLRVLNLLKHLSGYFLWITAFSTGEILISFFLVILASKDALAPLWSLAIMLSGLLFSVPSLMPMVKSLQKGGRVLLEAEKKERTLLLFGALVLLTSLFYTSSRLSYDASSVYFSLPKRIAISYKVQPVHPTDRFWISTLFSSILFTPLIQLFGDQAARALTWFQANAILLGIYYLGGKLSLSRCARLYAVILTLTTTAFVDLIGDGKVDLIVLTPVIVMLGWMSQSPINLHPKVFLVLGLYVGFAIIAKPSYFFLLIPFLGIFYLGWIFEQIRLHNWKQGLRFSLNILWMLPFALVNALLYLWLNAVLSDSPFAALERIGEIDWSPWIYVDKHTLLFFRLLYLPAITFMNIPSTMGNLSPIVIGILPFLVYKKIRSKIVFSSQAHRIYLAALSALILWVTFSFAFFEIRYVLFLWLLLFLFVAQVLEVTLSALPSKHRYRLRMGILLLAGFVAVRILTISIVTYSPIRPDGQAECSLEPFCTFFNSLNRNAPLGERVFVLHGYRYYLRPDLLACSSISPEYSLLREIAQKDGEAFWIELYRQGFRYVTYEVHFAEVHAHFPEIPLIIQEAPAWLKVSKWNTALYELKAVNPPFAPLKHCEQDMLGRWLIVESH